MSHADGSMTRSTLRIVPRHCGSTMLPLLVCLACRLVLSSPSRAPRPGRVCRHASPTQPPAKGKSHQPSFIRPRRSPFAPIRAHISPDFSCPVRFGCVSSTPPPLRLPCFPDFYHQDDMTTLSCLLTRIFAPMLLFACDRMHINYSSNVVASGHRSSLGRQNRKTGINVSHLSSGKHRLCIANGTLAWATTERAVRWSSRSFDGSHIVRRT